MNKVDIISLRIRIAAQTLSCVVMLGLLSSCASQQPVTPEAQHNTKVWILENNPQLEHPLIRRLFDSMLSRIAIGYDNMNRKMPDIEVFLIDNKKVGVFSICDGTIFISSGTIHALHSAHEMISMLAHDIAHVSLSHACEKVSDQETLLAYEVEADKLAIRTLLATHIDPHTLKQVYLDIYRKSESDDSRNIDVIDSDRLSKLEQNLSFIDQEIKTKIPEERLFRKVKELLKAN